MVACSGIIFACLVTCGICQYEWSIACLYIPCPAKRSVSSVNVLQATLSLLLPEHIESFDLGSSSHQAPFTAVPVIVTNIQSELARHAASCSCPNPGASGTSGK